MKALTGEQLATVLKLLEAKQMDKAIAFVLEGDRTLTLKDAIQTVMNIRRISGISAGMVEVRIPKGEVP